MTCRPRFSVFLWALAVLASAGTDWVVATETGEPAAPSLFVRTALALRQADTEQSALFARESLGELYAVYSAEADLARRQAGVGAAAHKLDAWSDAVDRYAQKVLLLLEDVEQGFPVHIDTRRNAVVVVSVADRRIMLTHPRVGQQGPYEARVLEGFCSRTDCATLIHSEEATRHEPVYAGAIRPEWRFGDGGASCYHKGVDLVFIPAVDLPRLRRLCRSFLQELEDLVQELGWQQVLDARIDWSALSIRPTPGHTQHFIVLNDSGDTVLSELPLLYANAALMPEIAAWLEQRLAGKEDAALQLDGNRIAGGGG